MIKLYTEAWSGEALRQGWTTPGWYFWANHFAYGPYETEVQAATEKCRYEDVSQANDEEHPRWGEYLQFTIRQVAAQARYNAFLHGLTLSIWQDDKIIKVSP